MIFQVMIKGSNELWSQAGTRETKAEAKKLKEKYKAQGFEVRIYRKKPHVAKGELTFVMRG